MKLFFFQFLFLISCRFALGEITRPVFLSTAKIQGFTITSEDLIRDLENDTVLLKGNVKVVYQNQYFEADQMEIFFKKKQAELKGHVKVQTPAYEIGGRQINLDYESNQGIIYVGYVQSNNVRFQGDLIEKINETEFYVSNAEYTTCSNCPETWSFAGNRIRAELGGYAYIKNSTLKVASFPVFWLPYLIVPLKSERQSGLLPPEFGHDSKRKLFLSEEIFWAISRSQDATLKLKNYELGGLKSILEYRYVLNEDSSGYFKFAYLNDSYFAGESRYLNYVSSENKESKVSRWAFKTYDQFSLSSNDKIQLNLSLVSDLQYPKDFYDEFKNYSEPALENRFTYTHFFDHSLVSIDTSYYKNLLQANPLVDNHSSVHRMPEIRFDSTYRSFFDTPFYYKIESSWVHFSRSKYYDDLSYSSDIKQRYVSNTLNDPTCEKNQISNCQIAEDQIYDETNDIIRTGKRFIFKTSLTTETYNLSRLINLTPTLSYNEAQYWFETEKNSNSSRRYIQLDLNTRTKFYKIYDDNSMITGTKYKNDVIPEVQYSWVPWIQQEENPFFGDTLLADSPYTSRGIISDSDLNTKGGILFDYEDRVYDRHIVTFSLLDRLIKKKLIDNSYKTLMTFRLTQSYDLYQSQYGKNKNQPLSNLTGTLELDIDHFRNTTQVDYSPYESATDTTTSISYLNDQQQYFKIGWASKRITDPKQDDILLALGFVSSYFNVLTGFIFDASENRESNSRLKKFSLITQLKPPGECWAVNFYRDQKISSASTWHVRFDFSFDGKPTKVIPPAELNIN